MNLDMVIGIATETKPAMGQACNNCGWCCLTEVCPVGKELGGGNQAPCKLLITKDDKHYCKLASDGMLAKVLDIGGGCDARTAIEQLMEYIK